LKGWRQELTTLRTIQQLTTRLDILIDQIHAIQAPNMHGEASADIVLLIAHGHLLRAFVKRWLKYPVGFPLSLMLEPGAVGILSYQDNDVNQPALMVGMGFPLAKDA
jgi:probable phosphoglycerate mutase